MRRLEIGLVAENIVRRDGQGRVMLEIARTLAGRGHTVTAYCAALAPEVRDRVNWVRIHGGRGPQLLKDPRFKAAVATALRSRAHDVVCTMGACAVPSEVPVAYYAAFTHCGWRSSWHEIGYKPPLHHRWQQALAARREARAVGAARSLMAISSRIADELRPLIKPEVPVTVVPGGVDSDEFSASTPAAKDAARADFGIENGAFVIALIGEYATGRKGLAQLAQAVELSKDRNETILVLGDGPESIRKELGVTAVFPDPQVPVPQVFAAADVVTVPSLYEPFSLVALEAAAAGIPLILSSRAGASGVLGPAGAAVIVDPFDAAAFRAAIDGIKRDADGAREMAAKARKVAESLSWESVGEQAAAVIEDSADG